MKDYFTKVEEQDGKFYQTYAQDVRPTLDYAKMMRDETDIKARKKGDMWHFASIPVSVAMEIKEKHNLDLLTERLTDKATSKRLAYILRTEYPYLLTI